MGNSHPPTRFKVEQAVCFGAEQTHDYRRQRVLESNINLKDFSGFCQHIKTANLLIRLDMKLEEITRFDSRPFSMSFASFAVAKNAGKF